MEFDEFTVVLLRWPDDMPDFSEEELERLQEGHIAFLAQMRERGLQLAAGPFFDQPDERLRGVAIFRTGLSETRALLAEDPSVKAGRLAPELARWMVPQGALPPG
ncbi:MAG: YCII-related protein [Solirubrobacteraceae bacterium]|nr:YCII-related protein [Solirubrobacteraceae bacterium]